MKNYSKKNTAIKLDEKSFKEKYCIKIRCRNYSKKNTALKLDEKLFKEKFCIKIR
jgi:hypothetical protein